MASFFEKLKRGMDIKNITETKEDIEKEEEIETPVKEIPPVSFSPKEITPEEMEEKLEDNKPKGAHIADALAKSSSLSSIVRETESKKKKIKKPKEAISNIEIKESSDFESEPELDRSKSWLETEGQLVVDVYETEDEIVIQSAIAGVNPEELDISIENDMVSIKGKRENLFEKKEKSYFYSECHWGYFSREIILPKEIDAKYAEALMKNGILTIRMPKIEREKKKISVR